MSQAGEASRGVNLFGWQVKSWLAEAQRGKSESDAELVYCASPQLAQAELDKVRSQVPAWQMKSINLEEADLWIFALAKAPLILLKPRALTEGQKRDGGQLAPSPFAQARDLLGRAFSEVKKLKVNELSVRFLGASPGEIVGGLVGLELAAYTYKSALNPALQPLPRLKIEADDASIAAAQNLAVGTNIARHLVNTPPNRLYPESFASALADLFAEEEGVSLEIWDKERLKREKMGLLLAVGQASAFAPCLVKIQFRPKGTTSEPPLALVGKGITFDSGGLDIKDPAGMRLMKKDMGGAAAIVGAFYAMIHSENPRPVDVYLPLAENAISGEAFRPSDVFRSKSGLNVEIHNTDAEGRLVLADAMAVATAAPERPAAVVVAATLTGAIKVALGADVAGFFANDETLAAQLSKKAQEFGDLMWRMPLFEGYRPKLETTTADIVHCATGSFGGAITAALFLAEFAKGFPFAHLDIYAWTDAERGALREAGGSGQAVQALVGFLQSYAR